MRLIHPGEVLRDELEVIGMNPHAFAKQLAVPPNRITSILKGERGVSADTALRLSRFFGTTPEFWLNLQATFDLKTAENKMGKIIQKEIRPYTEAA